ncbi:MAG: dehydrogenase [Zetaproteobacteria bacterium]|nr:MAG: dehydrogenase [Zetaproteobacteria bacterium]
MKQILQNLGTGETLLADIPAPRVEPGGLLIASRASLISAGTERMLVDFGRANLLQKARQQPEKVLQVVQKIRTDGVWSTLDAVRSKLDQPLPLGYCNAGVVLESRADGFRRGDRVASNGGHAEVVAVPARLCAKIPDGVTDEAAAFTVLGAIALQGIRLLAPTLGERIAVIGLGLIGQLCVQMLRAHGCRVLGVDPDPARCALARGFGAEVVAPSEGGDPVAAARAFSDGRGMDGVVITASARSDEIVHQAAQICRQRGRIVLVGVVGLHLRRDDFYKKELTFQVSCSYGPGRYDPEYEEKGHDYPFGLVRWTEQRNFEAVLELLADGRLDVAPLITERVEIDRALDAYRRLGAVGSLGTIIRYPGREEQALRRRVVALPIQQKPVAGAGGARLAVVGAGNYAARVLIPAFRRSGAQLDTLVSAKGVTAVHHGIRQGFSRAATRFEEVLAGDGVDAVVIATRHHLHAEQVLAALDAGKHCFVEKPLALTLGQIDRIRRAWEAHPDRLLMVGFNRRFAPLVERMHRLRTACGGPVTLLLTMNAGAIPADHWTRDPAVGGGRIIGEACHYVDLARFLAGAPLTGFQATAAGGEEGARGDAALIQLTFADGSAASIHYLTDGGKHFPKERIELFAQDAVLQLDNFLRLRSFGWPGFSGARLRGQDKGQQGCAAAFVRAVEQGGEPPIPIDELFEVSAATIRIADLLRRGSGR